MTMNQIEISIGARGRVSDSERCKKSRIQVLDRQLVDATLPVGLIVGQLFLAMMPRLTPAGHCCTLPIMATNNSELLLILYL